MSSDKPFMSFREYKSYGPYDLEEILYEKAKMSVEDKLVNRPVKLSPEDTEREHIRKSMDHAEAASALIAASKFLHPSQSKELEKLAKAHQAASRSNRKAGDAWSTYNSSAKGKKLQNRRVAKDSSETADSYTTFATSREAFSSSRVGGNVEKEDPIAPGMRERDSAEEHHRSEEEDHRTAAAHLKKAAGLVTSPDHHERLMSMANSYEKAANAHKEAADAHKEFSSGGWLGSSGRARQAKAATEQAMEHSHIARNT